MSLLTTVLIFLVLLGMILVPLLSSKAEYSRTAKASIIIGVVLLILFGIGMTFLIVIGSRFSGVT